MPVAPPNVARRNAVKGIAAKNVVRKKMPHKGKSKNYPSTPGHINPKKKK